MDVDPIPLAKGRRKSSGGLSGRKGLFGSFKSPRDKSALDAIGEAEADDAVGSRESVGEKVKKLFKSPRGNRSSVRGIRISCCFESTVVPNTPCAGSFLGFAFGFFFSFCPAIDFSFSGRTS